MRLRTYKSQGLVLRQYTLGEADRILSILTPTMGKVRVVAKSVRRPQSKLRGHLDLTNIVEFSASYGRNLDIVTEAQVRDDHPHIRSDLSLLSQAVYVCELADSFAEERSPSRDLYQLATVTLDLLPDSEDVWLVTRWFESRLLEVAGFKPQLESCVECGSELQPDDHMLDLAAGGVLCPQCRAYGIGARVHITESAMRVLRHLQRSRRFRDVGSPSIGRKIKNQVKGVHTRYIRAILERSLKSEEFIRRVAESEPYYDSGGGAASSSSV